MVGGEKIDGSAGKFTFLGKQTSSRCVCNACNVGLTWGRK